MPLSAAMVKAVKPMSCKESTIPFAVTLLGSDSQEKETCQHQPRVLQLLNANTPNVQPYNCMSVAALISAARWTSSSIISTRPEGGHAATDIHSFDVKTLPHTNLA